MDSEDKKTVWVIGIIAVLVFCLPLSFRSHKRANFESIEILNKKRKTSYVFEHNIYMTPSGLQIFVSIFRIFRFGEIFYSERSRFWIDTGWYHQFVGISVGLSRKPLEPARLRFKSLLEFLP